MFVWLFFLYIILFDIESSRIGLLFSISCSHDLLIRMFQCLFIVLKISLFSMSFSHDSVIKKFYCLQIISSIFSSQHHYTVREVSLGAKCNCNGYADGFDCPMDPLTKQHECRCQGNTCGLHCEQCCGAYNQYPWQPGSSAPWVWNGTATCEGL